MIDERGYRNNVGIVVANDSGEVVWVRRIKQKNAWQFPQGGIDKGETPKEAMYRELQEELGLMSQDVKLVSESRFWFEYRIPEKFQLEDPKFLFLGQRQKWFLLLLLCEESHLRLNATDSPEFSEWRWVDYWYPIDHIIDFKREVYQQVLTEFSALLG